jgi:hypothetical protein
VVSRVLTLPAYAAPAQHKHVDPAKCVQGVAGSWKPSRGITSVDPKHRLYCRGGK